MKILLATAASIGLWSIGLAQAERFVWEVLGDRLHIELMTEVNTLSCIMRGNENEPRTPDDGWHHGFATMGRIGPTEWVYRTSGVPGKFLWVDCGLPSYVITGISTPVRPGDLYPSVVEIGDLSPGETKIVTIRPKPIGTIRTRATVLNWTEDKMTSSSMWAATSNVLEGRITAVGAGELKINVHVRLEPL